MIMLETKRLILRSLIAQDAEAMYDYRNDARCARYQRGQTKDYSRIAELIERRQEDRLCLDAPFMAAAARKDTNEMIGEIVVMPDKGRILLGYTFSYRVHRQGYAYEAVSALMEVLHTMVPDWEFVCYTHPENTPSIGLLRKLGYQALGSDPEDGSLVFGKWAKPETAAQFACGV